MTVFEKLQLITETLTALWHAAEQGDKEAIKAVDKVLETLQKVWLK